MFVFVDGQVIAVVDYFLFRNKEALVGAGAGFFGFEVVEPCDDVGDVVVGGFGAFVVEGEAVGFHVVEPDLVGSSGTGLGEDEDGGRDSGIGLENARGHRDYCPELVVLDELPADGLVSHGRAEENAVGDDAGATPAFFHHAKEQGKEKKLGFLRVGDGFEVVVDALGIDSALERRVGETDGELVGNLVLLRDAVTVVDVGVADRVEHQVHRRDTEHGAVGVVAGEHGARKVLPLLGSYPVLIVRPDVFGGRDEEAGCAAGRVYLDSIFDTIALDKNNAKIAENRLPLGFSAIFAFMSEPENFAELLRELRLSPMTD